MTTEISPIPPSSDCKRMVPASTGANELGVWVTAPAMLISDETYFLNPEKPYIHW